MLKLSLTVSNFLIHGSIIVNYLETTRLTETAKLTLNASGEENLRDLHIAIEKKVLTSLKSSNLDQVFNLIKDLHFSDVADLLERVDDDSRTAMVEVLRQGFDAEILVDLNAGVREHVIDLLGVNDFSVAVLKLDSDDALFVLEKLDKEYQKQLLAAIPHFDRKLIEEGLAYKEDSAGRLMQRELVSVPETWNVGDTIDYLRDVSENEKVNLPDHFYSIFVVDPEHKPKGAISLDTLLRSKRPIMLSQIMRSNLKQIPVNADQEDVAFLFRQRDLVSASVVDELGRLVGVITIDDIVDVIDEEHEEDFMRLGGVREDDLYDATIDTTKSRFSWLLINLLTAIMTSLVISLFDGTIDQMVALAVLMPIVASMGGNAGTQTLTVVVRALAMNEITTTNARRIISKELIVGSLNGCIFSIIAGGVAWVWFGNPLLGGVIAMAMIINMAIAGLAGTTIPILLDRNKIDPAIASSVFITTITDVVGFFAFLGLATLILL
jgi:magnesium transporter